MMMIPSVFQNKKTNLIFDNDCMQIDFSPQVIMAIDDFQAILNSPAAITRKLYRPLADSFAESFNLAAFSDEEIDRVIREYLTTHGFNVMVVQIYYVDDPTMSAMTKLKYLDVPKHEVTEETKPKLLLDQYLSSYDRGRRQWYLTFTRLLHESAHALTPGLDRLCRAKISHTPYSNVTCDCKFKTPTKIGPTGWNTNDCGAGFEDLIFGGRIQTAEHEGSRPFFQELEIVQRPYLQYPPAKVPGNFIKKTISDDFISKFHTDITSWKSNTSNLDFFPSFTVVARSTVATFVGELRDVDNFFKKPKKRTRKSNLSARKKAKQSKPHDYSEWQSDEGEQESEESHEDLNISDDDDSLAAQDRAYEAMVSHRPHLRK